ncbi:MAG: rhomboid family intramembrane serine protease [Phenylobacterium sp.]|uniref:rhomboid family intramembrane serine protease n=1 Tax=Phenylobacterium sp. TaxID=1871053 RepID=UPI0025FC5117|nr:rhomboid family intramembrane serine protease [Phenylobacterium sp.]MCG9917471.1 rhomboid family intramembrane serine protease [Phenylobacterium sp.]
MSEPREPIFKAPWPAMMMLGAILGAYALQVFVLGDEAYRRFGFSPAGYEAGAHFGLVSALFIHGGFVHAAMNAAGALAFGSPVARLFGLRTSGALVFLGYYLTCGALANLAFAWVHPGEAIVLVGASGAVFGLIGAATRLLAGGGQLAGLLDRRVLFMSAAWIGLNLLIAVLGFAPGMDGAVAWEAHIAGYLAGLLLVGPAAGLARRLSPPAPAPGPWAEPPEPRHPPPNDPTM